MITFNATAVLLWLIALVIGVLIGALLAGDGLPDKYGNPGRPGAKLPPRLGMWLTVVLSALAVLVAMMG